MLTEAEVLSKCTFPYSKGEKVFTDSMKSAFDEFGFVIVKELFSTAEIEKLINFFSSSEEIREKAYGRDDGQNRKTKVAVWNHPGDDIGSMVSRSAKVVYTMRDLLGGHEIYHYHSKLMMKEAEIGGCHVWHQDYGYWYYNGCLFPDMGAVFLSLDPSTVENGCLQVLAGSHNMGRIDHGYVENIDDQKKGEAVQRGADLQRVAWAKERCPLIYCQLMPGDAIFFHSNLLHTSEQNSSKQRRWAMICSFNQARNSPTFAGDHPFYTPLDVVDDEDALMKCDRVKSSTDKCYYQPFAKAGDRKI